MADDDERLIKYIKCLGMLHKEDTNQVRDILTAFNHDHQKKNKKAKKIVRYQDLAELMLDDKVFATVMECAKKLLPSNSPFLKSIGGDDEPAQVKAYMQELPPGTLFRPKATLEDLIHFFQGSPHRYFVIIDEGSNSLCGIVSVNDFLRNLARINELPKANLVVEADFFNTKPKVVTNTDTMFSAQNRFEDAAKSGKKITKLLVVDDDNSPVGWLGENDIAKWAIDQSQGICF